MTPPDVILALARTEHAQALALIRLALIDLGNVQPKDEASEIALTVARANLRRALGEETAP